MEETKPYIPSFIRRLMVNASEQERLEATERLRRYLLAMYAIFLEMEAKKNGWDSMDWLDDDTLIVGLSEPHEI